MGKGSRQRAGSLFLAVLTVLSACVTLFSCCYLFGCILAGSLPRHPGRLAEWHVWLGNGSVVLGPMKNTLIMTACCLLISVPLGTGTAIFLSEYAGEKSRLANAVRLCAGVLAGIPSILYGMFGMVFFVSSLHMGYSMLAGSLTLAILVLPLLIQTGEEALRAVPEGLREGSRGLGAGKAATLFRIVLPQAATGILSGMLLAVGRIVGETAALLYTSGTAGDITPSVQLYLLSSEGAVSGREAGGSYLTATWRMALLLAVFVFVLQKLVGRLPAGQKVKKKQGGRASSSCPSGKKHSGAAGRRR